jgi:oligosaccharyl transferase (archaeosortase A-associated)
MNQRGFSLKLIAGILVAIFFGVALYLRVALLYDQVFVGDWIKFTGNDAYFFMRIVDNLVHNFPHLVTFDPYSLYPGGMSITLPPFWVYFIASITWLIGLGSPTQHTVDVVGVYFPAVLGALTVIPVYFIGKTLFSRWAGVIAAGLVAISPGEFLGRTVLGFTDYHVAEVLFTTVTMLFLILAVKTGSDKGMTFARLWRRQWATVTKPLIYSLLAGIFLGIYFLTWQGALLFVFIIFAYLVVQFIIDHLKGRSTDYLCLVSTITFIVALLLFLPLSPDRMSLASLIIAIVVPIALAVLSHFMAGRGIKPIFYLVALLGLGLVGLTIFHIVNPSLLQAMIGRLGIFTWPIGTTILEMQPLLFPNGIFSWSVAWANFTTGLFLCFISLGILIYLIVKRGETGKTLLIIWSLVMLAATLAMRRFAYYFVVNVALLAGYLAWLILEFSGFRERAAEPVGALRETKKKAKQKKRSSSRPAANRVYMTLAVIVVFFLVFFPNIGGAINTASHPMYAPSNAWCESLSWLKDNTPDPFGNPGFYYEFYEPSPPGKSYDYPQTAYGVTAWWDYGYWITRIGHRIPTSNPGTSVMGEAYLFAAQDEASANAFLDSRGSKYVIVDHAIAMPINGKFHAVATLSGNSQDKFYDVYYQQQGGRLSPVILFYPEYYRSLVVRLYNFDGKQVVPETYPVVSFEEKVTREGQHYKQITSLNPFSTYEEAQAYIASQHIEQKSGNYRIVGIDPFVSPVPLSALEHYKLIHSSDASIREPSGAVNSEVKIFEYVK